VRQDGRSASLTAPKGSAQCTLLLAALGRATLSPAQVGCTEAHGTGTALGDPTEAGALASVHGAAARPTPLTVGAAKASVGHSEAASGQVGLLKVQRLLADVACAGNAQLRTLNPLIIERLRGVSAGFVMPTQSASAVALGVSGVSSFGYSGTIVHAVVRRPSQLDHPFAAEPWLLSYRLRTFGWISSRPSRAALRGPST
jgi:acyl transferase domain-containing protein